MKRKVKKTIEIQLSVMDAECLSWQCSGNFVPDQPDRFEGPTLDAELVAMNGKGSLHWYENRADMFLAKAWLDTNGIACQIMSDTEELETGWYHVLWMDIPYGDDWDTIFESEDQ